ncbi:hypothetical protein GCM10010912_57940 [Paenibacillus albidus]|uniref:ESAT-6-like protein n=1 Tax=Paenibacillus albidus TaxID=2041023 RepID=A0A917D185_9BACL|nr:WXG100 family type VII secretion target [Paenibacillus albidus]GGG05714.1 hypothetical protein GCM10010912_57940 [Paenibacillus albidus]
MPTPQEIRRQAANVNSAAEDVRREQSKNDSSAGQSSTWWKGEAGDTYRKEYAEISQEITKLLNRLRDLQSQLSRLAAGVQRADEERARARAAEEAAQRALAAAAKKK